MERDILAGGTGGLGQSLTRWMVSEGARHIVLLSRRGGAADLKLKELVCQGAEVGARVALHTCDITDRQQLDHVLAELSALPPVRGVIQAAMVLRVSEYVLARASYWN